MSNRQRTRLKHEYFLLGLLYKQPRHGYDLMKAVQQSPGLSAIWFVKPGRIYALLDRLEQANMVTSAQIESQSAPSRKQYSLTKKGETAYLDWVRQPVTHGRDMRLIFAARLYFALQLGNDFARALISVQYQECTSWLEEIQTHAAEEDDFYANEIRQYRAGQIEAMIKWLTRFEKELSSKN